MKTPKWMESLIDVVFGCIEVHNTMGPFGFRYGVEEDIWEIIAYPCPVELTGESIDETVVAPGFSLDIEQLRSAFDQLDETFWNAHGFGPYDSNGPHVSIEGVYKGHRVHLLILAYAPEDEEPGTKLNVSGKLGLISNN